MTDLFPEEPSSGLTLISDHFQWAATTESWDFGWSLTYGRLNCIKNGSCSSPLLVGRECIHLWRQLCLHECLAQAPTNQNQVNLVLLSLPDSCWVMVEKEQITKVRNMVLYLPTQIYLTCRRQSRSIIKTIIGGHVTAIYKETIQRGQGINLTAAFVQRFNTGWVIIGSFKQQRQQWL